ncbi:MAG: class I SAM-dependent methyltransferase [Bacillus sp. (in: firmicutes)]
MKQQEVIQSIAHLLEQAKIPYTIVEEAALYVQGMALHCADIKVLVQWDVFSACYELFAVGSRSDIGKTAAKAEFTVQYEGMPVHIFCLFNTTVRTDPYRIEENGVWCRSLYSYLYGTDFSAYKTEITRFLHNKQQALTAQNEQAWNQNNYQALLARYGDPAEVAKKIQQNPEWRIYPFGKYMPNLNGKKVLHLLGSNGVKATAMASLGADVTVVDFSQENAKFAEELANAAEVDIDYIVSDVFSMPEKQGEFDYVLMELGVLHYFITLEPLMELIKETLAPGGRFILHEFHPISTKLITSNGKKHKVTGNYFAPELTYQSVAFSKHMPDGVQEELMQTVQRKWTIGELVTSVAASGLRIEILEEEPNHKLHDIGLPKTYTLVAEK